jgi:multidrug efflux pump subunit AcrA (membrane-fusion protein)
MLPIQQQQLSSYTEIEKAFIEAGLKPKSVGASHTPKVLNVFFRVGILLLILFIILILIVPWQQVSIGQGTVISYSTANRGQRVQAPVHGRIDKWLVQEGEEIKKGQSLVEIIDFDEQILERLQDQLRAAEVALNAAKQAVEIGKNNLNRQSNLYAKGLTSERELELAKIDLSKYESDLSSAQSKYAELNVKISRQSSQSVASPFDGTVVRILVPEGGTVVDAGDILALLVPNTKDRAVELIIKGIDLPLISVGRKARIQFEGWPAVQFTGWPSVAIGTFGGIVGVVDAIDDGKGNYRVLVFPDPEDEPWPEQRFLRQGIRAIGWIMLDEVKLGWELWRRLNSFPMTVDQPIEKKEKIDNFINKKLR